MHQPLWCVCVCVCVFFLLLDTILTIVVQAMRLFVGEPVWTPLNRPQDDHPVRKDYVQNLTTAAATAT